MGKIISHNNRILKYRGTQLITPPSSGMVVYLDAENPASYPGTGLTWTDLSGLNNHCNLNATNPPAYDSYNKTLQFVAANSNRATIPHHSSLNFGTGEFTILHYSDHPNTGSVAGTTCAVLYKGANYNANGGQGWLITSNAGATMYHVVSAGLQATKYEAFVINNTLPATDYVYNYYRQGWYGLVRRGGQMFQVFDGLIYPSKLNTANCNSTVDISIGFNAFYGGANSYFHGSIQKILMYNRGLSDAEISKLNKDTKYKILSF